MVAISEFLAEAQIVVRANTKPFVADFEKAVKQVEKRKILVVVRPDFKGFREALVTGLNRSKRGVFVGVPVRPDMTGFRAALQAGVLKSGKGVFATVGVRTGDVTRGAGAAAAGGGGARTRALTAEQAILKAEEAGIFARKRITGLIDEQEKRLARIARQEAAITAAEQAGVRAVQEQNAALQIRAAQIEKAARAELAVTKAAFEKRDPARKAAAAEAERTAERSAQAAANAELRAQEAVRDKSRQAERDFAERRIAAREREVASLLRIERAGIAKQEAQRLSALKRTQTQLRNIQTDIAGITGPSLAALGAQAGSEAALRRQITVLTHAETEAKKVLAVANKAAFASEAELASALVTETAALRANAVAALGSAKAHTSFAHTLDNVRRAVVAEIASFTGLRGATLTAASAFIATVAALVTLGKAIRVAAELQSQLSVFQVTAGATAEEMEHVRERAVELGRDITLPAVSAGDAAVALTELSKAGLDTQDAIDGARGVLQLATAANIDFTQATQLSASALNAFGLAGEEASHVADVLANSANESQGSITDAGVALQQSAAVARQAGLTLEQTVAALTLFARAGLRGSDAGTSLRTALIRLINPSEKAEGVIEDLGLRLRTASGAIDLSVFQQFTDATRDLTAAQRDQALAIVFGQDAIRGAAILAREGARGLEESEAAINKVGTAAVVASARTSGFAGAQENLKNQIETLGEEIGSTLLPALTQVVDAIADAVGETADFIALLKELGKTAKEAFPGLPQFKLGPIDTREFDRSFFDKLSDLAAHPQEILFPIAGLARVEAQVDTEEARQQIQEFVSELNKAGRTPLAFQAAVSGLLDLQKKLEGGDEQAREFSETLGEFIRDLQLLSSQPATEVKITIPREVLSGEAIADAGQKSAFKFGETFLPTIQEIGKQAAKALAQGILDPGAVGAIRAAGKAVAEAQGQAAGFARAETRARIKGDVDAQIEALREGAERRRRIIAAINRVTGGGPRGARLEIRTRAEEELAQILDQITSLEEQQAKDVQEAAQRIKDARDKADQAFLDALEVGRTPFERQVARAQATEGTRDDIVALQAFRKRLQSEVDQVRTGVRDAQTRAQELRRLNDELFQNSQDIQDARRARNEALQAALEEKGVALVSLGEATDNIRLIIQGLDLQIARAKDVLVKAKAAKIGIEAAKAALAALKKTRRETVQEAKETLLESAFELAEARGQKNLMLQILDLQIKQANQQVRAARTLTERLEALTTVAQLNNKKREILEGELKEATEGTTVFELLQQARETFNQAAGSLIDVNQTIAGATGFTADIAGFLRRRRPIGIGTSGAAARSVAAGRRPLEDNVFRGLPRVDKQIQSTDDLIKAINRLIVSIDTAAGTGNASTAANGPLTQRAVDALGARYTAMAKFWDSHRSKMAQDS